MRKKTIEEELKEIAEEKDNHIETLHNEYLSSNDNHAFDFDNCTIKESKSSDSEVFTKEDRERLDAFHHGKIDLEDDANWDEYNQLIDKYNRALKNDKVYYNSNAQNTSNRSRKTASVKESLIGALFLCIFVAAGICVMLFAGILPMIRNSKINYVEVESTITSVGVSFNDSKTIATMGVDFEYNQVKYHAYVKRDITNSPTPAIGEKLTIEINPADPLNLKIRGNGNYVPPLIIGAVFAGFGIILQITLITQAVKARKLNKTTT